MTVILSTAQIDELMRLGGWAQIRFRTSGYGRGMKLSSYYSVPDPTLAYGYIAVETRHAPPSSKEIFLMDETSRWLSFVENNEMRRVVALRMLWDEDRGKCIHSYEKIARQFHTSAYKIRKQHQSGLLMIARHVNQKNTLLSKIKLYVNEVWGA